MCIRILVLISMFDDSCSRTTTLRRNLHGGNDIFEAFDLVHAFVFDDISTERYKDMYACTYG